MSLVYPPCEQVNLAANVVLWCVMACQQPSYTEGSWVPFLGATF